MLRNTFKARACLRPINYESSARIFIVTDASNTGIGSWIGQENKATGEIILGEFYSRKLNNA